MRPAPLALALLLAVSSAAAVASAEPPPAPSASAKAPAKRVREKPAPARHEVVVTVLHATNQGQGIDKKIGNMPELKSPPFSSFDTYRLFGERRIALSVRQSRNYRLPNGRVLQAELLDVLPREFVRLSASINQPGGKAFLPLLEVKAKLGQAFIVAGQRYKNGILVLVIRVVPIGEAKDSGARGK